MIKLGQIYTVRKQFSTMYRGSSVEIIDVGAKGVMWKWQDAKYPTSFSIWPVSEFTRDFQLSLYLTLKVMIERQK